MATKRGGNRPKAARKGDWGVWDRERHCLYVPCLFEKEEWAEAERESLLLHFPAEHPWRKRLAVRKVAGREVRVGKASARDRGGELLVKRTKLA